MCGSNSCADWGLGLNYLSNHMQTGVDRSGHRQGPNIYGRGQPFPIREFKYRSGTKILSLRNSRTTT
jgi:hypothetical protein